MSGKCHCGFELLPDDNCCGECGTRCTLCAVCGANGPEGRNFCGDCGANPNPVAAPPTPGTNSRKEKSVAHTLGIVRNVTSKFKSNLKKCPECAKTVYTTEGIRFNGADYHVACFNCQQCSNTLTLSNAVMHDGQRLCNLCQKLTIRKKVKKTKNVASTGGATVEVRKDLCPVCGKTAYQQEAERYNERYYHTACFACVECGNPLRKVKDVATETDNGPLYCHPCMKLRVTHKQTRVVKSATTNSKPLHKLALKLGGGDLCPSCGKRAYKEESFLFNESYYHKGCMNCERCTASLQLHQVVIFHTKLYCKKCQKHLVIHDKVLQQDRAPNAQILKKKCAFAGCMKNRIANRPYCAQHSNIVCEELDGPVDLAPTHTRQKKDNTATPAYTTLCPCGAAYPSPSAKFCIVCGKTRASKVKKAEKATELTPVARSDKCKCGATFPSPSAKFCISCGATRPKASGGPAVVKKKKAAPSNVCPCGAKLPANALFCVECGAKTSAGGGGGVARPKAAATPSNSNSRGNKAKPKQQFVVGGPSPTKPTRRARPAPDIPRRARPAPDIPPAPNVPKAARPYIPPKAAREPQKAAAMAPPGMPPSDGSDGSKSGFMKKTAAAKGKDEVRNKNGNWKERWFVLNGDSMKYYKKYGDASPKGTINLKGAQVGRADDVTGKAFCIRIAQYPNKFHYLQAASQSEADDWVMAMSYAIVAAD